MSLLRHNCRDLFKVAAGKQNALYINSQVRTNTTIPAETDNDEASAMLEVEDQPRRAVKTDKSGLLPQHRNMLHNQRPYDEAHSWIHMTEKYQRSIYGKYGEKSGIDPRYCFPIKEDVAEKERYLKFAFPQTVPELMAELAEERKVKQEQIKQREDAIAKKIEKLDVWKKELHDKVAKKEADALAAKQRKERLVEEVRRHFGFNVDPRDERFKEMLEQKEREDKKKQKEAKRKAKEEKLIAKLTQK